jgi:PAS domain S-box-containing protein
VKQSLKSRLTINFVALAVIPLLLVALVVAWLGFTVERRQALALEGEVALRVAERMQTHVTGLADALLQAGQAIAPLARAARGPVAATGVAHGHGLSPVLPGGVRRLDRLFHMPGAPVLAVQILDADGTTLLNRGAGPAAPAPQRTASDDAFVAPMTTGLVYYGPVTFSLPGARPMMTLGVPLPDPRTGKPAAVLVADCRLDGIRDMVADTTGNSGEVVYVVDAAHRVVAHPDANVVLAGTLFTPPREEGVQKGLSGTLVLLAMRPVALGAQVLTVIAERTMASAMTAALGAIVSLAAAVLVGVLMSVSLALFTARRVFAPIENLARAARAVQAGDLGYRARADAPDELGELAVSFNSMTCQLSSTLAGLQDKVQELTRTQQKLGEREKAYRDLFETSAEGILVTDERLRVLEANQAMLSMLGHSYRELTGLDYEDLIPADAPAENPAQAAAALLASGGTVRSEQRLLRRDGSSFVADISARAVDQHRIQLVVRDVTARKRMEADLVAARTAAEDASRAKGEFLANMSHELRTPISNVMGMIDMTLSTNPTDEQRAYLLQVKASAASLLRIINDVLDLSKIEANRLRLLPEDFDLHDLVERILASFGPDIRPKRLRLTWEAAPSVPRYVRTDPDRLGQVLTNLVGNAVKFTPHGAVAVRLSFHNADPARPRILFEITDTGIGIPDNAQATLFDNFTQVDSSYSKRFQGTGLGLAICKRLVEMLGGSIWVESEPGQGSSFFFTIAFTPARATPAAWSAPLDEGPRPNAGPANAGATEAGPEAERANAPEPHAPLPDAALAAPDAAPGPRVLVAERNGIHRLCLRTLLTDAGYRVQDVPDADAALAALAAEAHDIVLLDTGDDLAHNAPGLAAVRAAADGAPVIALTSAAVAEEHARAEEKARARARPPAGGDGLPDDCIARPFDRETVLTTIRRVLARTPGA